MFVFKQKAAYELRISDWSSDVCSSDLDSVVSGLRAHAGADKVTLAESAAGVDPASYDAIVAVIGETPYAETRGDIVPSATLGSEESRVGKEGISTCRSRG